jgi:hypothetical protein
MIRVVGGVSLRPHGLVIRSILDDRTFPADS